MIEWVEEKDSLGLISYKAKIGRFCKAEANEDLLGVNKIGTAINLRMGEFYNADGKGEELKRMSMFVFNELLKKAEKEMAAIRAEVDEYLKENK